MFETTNPIANPDTLIHHEWINKVADEMREGRILTWDFDDPILDRLMQIARIKANAPKLLECN